MRNEVAAAAPKARDDSPIFVLGRQHSGNTMLATILRKTPGVLSLLEEGNFFERRLKLGLLPLEPRIRELLKAIRQSDSPPIAADVLAQLEQRLRREMGTRADHRNWPAERLYVRAMELLAEMRGASRWAQKATSYVFYVDAIMRAIPTAKFVYLVRNPLDIAASVKKRGYEKAFARVAIGWARGLRLARKYASENPANFLMSVYEDIVKNPTAELGRIYQFLGLEFSPDYLEIPHVNPADHPYKVTGDNVGVVGERVGYWHGFLSAKEAATVRALVSSRVLNGLYPSQGNGAEVSRLALGVSEAYFYAVGMATGLYDHAKRFLRDPPDTIDRLRRRVL